MNAFLININAPVNSSLGEINCIKLGYFCLSSIDDKGCFLSMPIDIHMVYSIDHYG